jgi:hypothetical protein
MNCTEKDKNKASDIQEALLDLAAGSEHESESPTPQIASHIASCPACAAQLREMKQTMALLDQWQAPEPSPYFDVRLQARLREEMALPPVPWYRRWLRTVSMRPAWAMSLATVLFAVAIISGNRSYLSQTDTIATKPPVVGVPAQPGTAVADLQALESNNELYADFDVLDDLQVQDDVTANP